MLNFIVALLFALNITSAQAGIGTLMLVECNSIAQGGRATSIVTSTRTSGRDGYTTSMTLTVKIRAANGFRTESFSVKTTEATEKGDYTVRAVSASGNLLELIMDQSEEGTDALGFGYSDLKVNGQSEDHLKLECKAPRAG